MIVMIAEVLSFMFSNHFNRYCYINMHLKRLPSDNSIKIEERKWSFCLRLKQNME